MITHPKWDLLVSRGSPPFQDFVTTEIAHCNYFKCMWSTGLWLQANCNWFVVSLTIILMIYETEKFKSFIYCLWNHVMILLCSFFLKSSILLIILLRMIKLLMRTFFLHFFCYCKSWKILIQFISCLITLNQNVKVLIYNIKKSCCF